MSVPYIHTLYGKDLDNYLAKGWFRLGRHIHTTDAILINEQFYPAYWIRYRTDLFQWHKKYAQIFKAAKQFTVATTNFYYNEFDEDLYRLYMNSRQFSGTETLRKFLYEQIDGAGYDIMYYRTLVISVFHNEQCIAKGLFDKGSNSIAGIINYFNPSYQKFSLGKLIMLLKLQFAIDNQMPYYYPGYIVPGISHFDYKTYLGTLCIEVWDTSGMQWIPYDIFFPEGHKAVAPKSNGEDFS